MSLIRVGVKKLYEDVKIPEYATTKSACFDVRAYLNSENYQTITAYKSNNEKFFVRNVNGTLELRKHYRYMVPTGLIFDIPDGYSLRVHPRSGISLKNGIFLVNCEGVIDTDYKLETFILLTNLSTEPYILKHDDRVCQVEVVPRYVAEFYEISELGNNDDYGESEKTRNGGFGSTGLS